MPASSSGVPEVMGFLNGNVVQQHFTLVAYIIKFFSCSLGVSAGLPIGPEGPMVTIGFVSMRYSQLSLIFKKFNITSNCPLWTNMLFLFDAVAVFMRKACVVLQRVVEKVITHSGAESLLYYFHDCDLSDVSVGSDSVFRDEVGPEERELAETWHFPMEDEVERGSKDGGRIPSSRGSAAWYICTYE